MTWNRHENRISPYGVSRRSAGFPVSDSLCHLAIGQGLPVRNLLKRLPDLLLKFRTRRRHRKGKLPAPTLKILCKLHSGLFQHSQVAAIGPASIAAIDLAFIAAIDLALIAGIFAAFAPASTAAIGPALAPASTAAIFPAFLAAQMVGDFRHRPIGYGNPQPPDGAFHVSDGVSTICRGKGHMERFTKFHDDSYVDKILHFRLFCQLFLPFVSISALILATYTVKLDKFLRFC
jgi:hypothetical protein